MSPSTYLPRVADAELSRKLGSFGAVLIEGPKACGKTETARQAAASEVRLDVDINARNVAATDPALVLEGPTPRLVDEWQEAPTLWNQMRREVDDRDGPGQFIFTGSAVPPDDSTRHSGALRVARIRMRPMSLFESGHSTGDVPLPTILDGANPRASDPGHKLTDVIDRVCVGGWPALQKLTVADAMSGVRGYLDTVRRTDINRVDGVKRDPQRVGRLLQSLARNTATSAAIAKIAAETHPDNPLSRETTYDYIDVLERLLVIEDQRAWAPALRSRYQLRTTPVRHFVCPSLSAAALRASPKRLLNDLNLFGLLFESLVVRDLRIYSQSLEGEVFYYRDNKDLEVDAIVELPDSSWGAFEIKLGGDAAIETAAASLLTFAKRVDTTKTGDPAILAVITATGYAYVRSDGVAVIPIGTLGP